MTLQRMTVFGVALIVGAMLAGVSCADTIIAYDSSGDEAYTVDSTYIGLDGGTGYEAWGKYFGYNPDFTITDAYSGAAYTPVLDNGTAFFIDGNDAGTSNDDKHKVLTRILDSSVAVGDTFSIVLKKEKATAGGNYPSHYAGVFLYNSSYFNSSDVRLMFGTATEKGPNWCILSGGNTLLDTGVAADDTAIRVGFTVTGAETYDLSLEKWNATAGVFDVVMPSTPGSWDDLALSNADTGGALDCFRIYNMRGCGDILFNDITVSQAVEVPEPGVLSLLAGLAFLGLWIKRR